MSPLPGQPQNPPMKKINTHTLEEHSWTTPGGRFGGAGKELSEAPDSGKWLRSSPERRIVRSEHLEYYDGEE